MYGILKKTVKNIYEVAMSDGREVLIPAIKECILSVDIEGRKMVVHLLDGLLD